MTEYYTKRRLYNDIHRCKAELDIPEWAYDFNMIELCKAEGIKLEILPFKTKALRGMAAIGNNYCNDVILLNTDRTDRERNFDCAHEYVHLRIHRKNKKKVFNCIDAVYAKQDEYIEWQANEGAAELFVPMSALLPMIKERYYDFSSYNDIEEFKAITAERFKVTGKVIEYRLESLKYEINQYLSGVPINDIEILSLAEQKRKNIIIESINDIENNYFDKSYEAWRNRSIIDYNCTLPDYY